MPRIKNKYKHIRSSLVISFKLNMAFIVANQEFCTSGGDYVKILKKKKKNGEGSIVKKYKNTHNKNEFFRNFEGITFYTNAHYHFPLLWI